MLGNCDAFHATLESVEYIERFLRIRWWRIDIYIKWKQTHKRQVKKASVNFTGSVSLDKFDMLLFCLFSEGVKLLKMWDVRDVVMRYGSP